MGRAKHPGVVNGTELGCIFGQPVVASQGGGRKGGGRGSPRSARSFAHYRMMLPMRRGRIWRRYKGSLRKPQTVEGTDVRHSNKTPSRRPFGHMETVTLVGYLQPSVR